MYNNNNNGGGYRNGGGYSRNSRSNYPAGRQNSGYGQQRQEMAPKKSGAVYSRIKKGKNEGGTSVNAWRKTRNGLLTASCFPVDGLEHTSQSGRVHLRYVVEVVNRDMGTTQTYWCLMEKNSRKIYISELGLVISPNGSGQTSSGRRVTGYFGKVK